MPFLVVNEADEAQRLINTSPADGTLERLGTKTAEQLNYALRYAVFKIKK